ncbi:MAG: magnesium transporter, partial [Bradyrhizobium sp.]|nr:magnesium transporter [Bradyrhizobium sp.]
MRHVTTPAPAEAPAPQGRGRPREPGVVAAGVYAGGRRVVDIAIEDAGAWSKRPGHVVWIGLHEPDAALLQRI